MLPAQQRLESNDSAGFQRDDRLVIVPEFLPLDGIAQIGFDLQAASNGGAHLGIEDLEARFTAGLRTIHGGIGVAQKLLRVLVAQSAHGNSDADGREDFSLVDVKGLSHVLHQPFCDAHDIGRLPEVTEQNGELVSTEPCDGDGFLILQACHCVGMAQ